MSNESIKYYPILNSKVREPTEPFIQTEKAKNLAKDLMVRFGDWLEENDHDKVNVAKYSNPENTERRLRLTDLTDYRTTDGDITAMPIELFKDVEGVGYKDSSDWQKKHFDSWQIRLKRSLGKLANVSRKAKDEVIGAKEARKEVVDSLNELSSHDDGQKKVVNGTHFSSSGLKTFASKDDPYWLGRLQTAYDSAKYYLTDSIVAEEDILFKRGKTTLSDGFIYDNYEDLKDTLNGWQGYIVVSQLLFGGDMKKAYVNISAVAKMTGKNKPDGWRVFQGSTAEFDKVENVLGTAKGGLDGYKKIANEQFGGDMQKAYVNISAVAEMTGKNKPDGWRQFQGSTAEFDKVENVLGAAEDGLDGYKKIANEQFGGDMKKTYENISAVAEMTGKNKPDGWRVFQGSTAEFDNQATWLSSNEQASLKDYRNEFYPSITDEELNNNKRNKAVLNFAVIK